MELNWTTFALETLNFLVLVWILKRFLYKPVLDIIERRKAGIERVRYESERMRREAEALRNRYESRLVDWEREREKARAQLLVEISAERARLLEGLRASLEQEREKARALEERRLNDLARQAEEAGIAQGGQFVALLLSRMAGPDLEARLVALVLKDLHDLPEERRQAFRAQEQWEAVCAACAKPEVPVVVASAFPLSPDLRETLGDGLQQLIGRPVSIEWVEDNKLLAGVRISLGPWVLRANLQDEMKFFSEATYRDNR